ncbi:glycoside hydrolase family 36 protein [Anaerocolumna sp. MB42-C2]|uniref:glycoside hydrolase family 36 protein n=1 Tax=Anaerocolumna sp. MB42-C2 TaxID=3070997 RepID=UPI0027DEE119|nr:glycoside hydrolase family 36 protein [Anaerocolumna sp. MB42-C2]WMJ86280.1 alpha-galactosidase [Anaerocolumna sp. MB42-C2]
MERININENGIYMVFEIADDKCFKLLHFSAKPFREEDIIARSTEYGFRFVEINLAGYDRPYERHGNKYIVTAPGYHMRYESHTDEQNETERKLTFTLVDEITKVYVYSHMQFFKKLSVIRLWNEVKNCGEDVQTLDYISSFNYEGIEKEGKLSRDEKMSVWVPHNSWQREMNWKKYTLPELGMELVQPAKEQRSSNLIQFSNTGNWSAKEHLPMAYLENTETKTGLIWQIEHNGSWHWEIGDQNGHLYLAVSGPNETYSHWFKNLNPGDTFTTVPVAVGVTERGFEDAVGTLTNYRRRIRRPNADNESLRIIFNDYMNCLWGKPTAEQEFPLVDAAAEAGCEYFCIDAGWYADGDWWDEVGEWQESRKRFPNGLREITDYIRAKGMIPGVWLELEVMGINCNMAKQVPDDWFFTRHGKRVYDRSRYQLDYRNPEVTTYANGVIDRLVKEYGVGYIKMDYNIEPGIGTERNADSVGDGMLGHERAYLNWLDGVFAKYPELIIENCSSGGLRIDYAMLSRYSIQSTSDQDNYRCYCTIAANSPSGLTPEQSAIWSYPLTEGDKEEVVFNMVNAILLRIHQSGHLANLSTERKELVKEALDIYKSIRQKLKTGLPVWPLGLSEYSDEWVSFGLQCEETLYLAVWRREGSNHNCTLPIPAFNSKAVEAKCLYPSYSKVPYSWDSQAGEFNVTMDGDYMARLFKLSIK